MVNTMKEKYLSEIIEKEWDMFTSVNAINKNAPCLNNKREFTIVRLSQWMVYDEEILKSYLEDIDGFTREGRNIVAEKYAWMMETTEPKHFSTIRHLLGPVSEEKQQLIEAILLINKYWYSHITRELPNTIKYSREVGSLQDKIDNTSVETYMRGEFNTYSEKTLRKILKYYLLKSKEGVNIPFEIIKNQVVMEMR